MMFHGAQAQFNDFEGHVSLQECSGEAQTGPSKKKKTSLFRGKPKILPKIMF